MVHKKNHSLAFFKRHFSSGKPIVNFKMHPEVNHGKLLWQVVNDHNYLTHDRKKIRGEFFKGRDTNGTEYQDASSNQEIVEYPGMNHWIRGYNIIDDVCTGVTPKVFVSAFPDMG